MSEFKKLIVEGDRHIEVDKQGAFHLAHQMYNEWIRKQPWNSPDNVWCSLGDFFDAARPTPKEYGLGLRFFEQSSFGHHYIIAGNHDYHRASNTYSIDPLEEFDNVTNLYEEQPLRLGEVTILILPYFYPNIRSDVGTMKERYESLHETALGEQKYDFIFGHLFDQDMYGEWVDISNLKGTPVLGHDHGQHGNYLGSPMPTSYTIRGQQGRLLEIDLETKETRYIEVPRFLDYGEVTYPTPLPETKSDVTIWTVNEAVDKQAAIDHYSKEGDFFYRAINLKKDEAGESAVEFDTEGQVKLTDWFNRYCAEKGKPEELRKSLLPVIQAHES